MKISNRWQRLVVGAVTAGVMASPISLPLPAVHADATTQRVGDCSSGRGEWRLRLHSLDSKRIRITFRVDNIAPETAWQVFVSDKHHRVLATTRRAGADREFHVSIRTRNRKGVDRVQASAVNTYNGTICRGSARR